MKKWNGNMIRQSLLSGILIGMGGIINLLSGNKYIGAMLFSFALLTIIHNGLPLYTGRIGFIRENKITDLLQILVFNLIGAPIPIWMVMVCKEEFRSTVQEVADTKFSYNFLQLFLLGTLCGILMLIAVYSKKTVITVFCIMIFILSGYNHCIADFPFLTVHPDMIRAGKFLCIILGNSAGAIVTYELIRTRS